MKSRDLLKAAAGRLAEAGCHTPRLDAELLLMHAWGIERTALIIRANDEVPLEIAEQFEALLKRREEREPLAHLVGEKEFWSRPFRVSSDVLVPRPETEHLIEALIEHLPDRQGEYRFLDVGTGSGCIAVTLACEYPNAHVVATDISEVALAVARENAARHGVTDRIHFRQGDMFGAIGENDCPFDAILSNPPYVASHEMDDLEPELAFEPRGALTDEADGLSYLSLILNEGGKHLKPGGLIIVETGPCGLPETPDTLKLLDSIRDLAGHLRGGVYRAG